MAIIFIIIFAALARLLPHMPNAGLITAIAIFAGAYLPWRKAAVMTVGARLLSDLLIGFFAWKLMVAVYVSHAVGILLGKWVQRTGNASYRWLVIGASGFLSALVFYLVTNFAFLYSEYPYTWAGIVQSYINGLPFLRGTLVGDVGYTVVLFGAYELVKVAAPKFSYSFFRPKTGNA